jgi:hypothetical protein
MPGFAGNDFFSEILARCVTSAVRLNLTPQPRDKYASFQWTTNLVSPPDVLGIIHHVLILSFMLRIPSPMTVCPRLVKLGTLGPGYWVMITRRGKRYTLADNAVAGGLKCAKLLSSFSSWLSRFR